ncbi:MAG: DUF4198 domain-containing protein [Herminiimonas sp.]|nr:DUF4198 domain-containing protein [Herminiimonas sp.]
MTIFLRRLRAASVLLFALCCALAGSVSAHEFWMRAQPAAVAVGGATRLSLNVGEYFSGDVVAFSVQYVAALRHIASGVDQDLLPRVAKTATVGAFPIRLQQPGTHLFAYDSHPNRITLGGEKFHAYLHDEGMDEIVKQREQAGTGATPARERYRRYVKTLVEVGGKHDGSFAVKTGQRLEIVPIDDPLTAGVGDKLQFSLLFEQKPLANALIKAWYLHDDQTVTIRARTDAAGRFAFNLPYAGTWMLSVVHMIPTIDSTEDDWDSLWGNLSFDLKPRR